MLDPVHASLTVPQSSTSPLWSLPSTVLVPLLGLPAFWVACFLIYCVKCAIFGMDRTPRIDQVTKTPWLPRIFMEFGYWMFRIPVRFFIALGITPNMITLGSMLLTVVASIAIAMGHFGFGGWTLLLAFVPIHLVVSAVVPARFAARATRAFSSSESRIVVVDMLWPGLHGM